MVNTSTLFLILLTLWIIILGLSGNFSPDLLLLGMVSSVTISTFSGKIRIVHEKDSFLFLQFGFYKYIWKMLNENFMQNFTLAFDFLFRRENIEPVVDFIFLNKNEDAEVGLCVNVITLKPGSICIAMKKKYVIVHMINKNYFSLVDMFSISKEVSLVHDDSLI